jgi:ABC-2 type transport system permease protein
MSTRSDSAPHHQLTLLLRTRGRAIRNHVVKAVAEAPIRVSTAALLIALIWVGLYALFWLIFMQFDERTPLESTVAIPLVFNFFFAAMLVLLTFSNAIIAHGSLFGRGEPEYLLSSPVHTRDVVMFKYLESLLISSWSLILLGLPLMMAMAHRAEDPVFFAIFIAFFLAFIPIPGALGLMLAYGAARWLPRRAKKVLTIVFALVLVVTLIWGLRSLRMDNLAAEAWLRSFLGRMSFVESALLPNNWVARGIDCALHDRIGDSLMYLAVTGANALFLSWLVVLLVGSGLSAAYDRASAGSGGERRICAPPSGGVCGRVFFYLPAPLRLIATKDLRTFLRDPLQWSQLLILFGLIILYLTNMPSMELQFIGSRWTLIIPFLNLSAISLILAAFTCRFVFPLVSLEGRQLWLIGLLPMPRGRILLAKFCFSLTVTLFVTFVAMALATIMLDLDLVWTGIHLVTTVAVCIGLCGLAVGIGARLPMFHQPNAARIANGLGGTINLLASLALVTLVLMAVGVATWRSRNLPYGSLPPLRDLALCAAASLAAIVVGVFTLELGARHFDRVES